MLVLIVTDNKTFLENSTGVSFCLHFTLEKFYFDLKGFVFKSVNTHTDFVLGNSRYISFISPAAIFFSFLQEPDTDLMQVIPIAFVPRHNLRRKELFAS